MGLFEIKNIEFVDESDLIIIPRTNLKWNDVDIVISFNREESLKYIKEDFEVLQSEGIEELIKNNFIPWLKGDGFKDLDDEKIFDSLKVSNITYHYQGIISKYSPTKEDGFFGQFTFEFTRDNDYTEALFDAVAFVVLVGDGKIYMGKHYDI